MSSSYVMRPSRLDDFEVLMQLAEESGPGFTSLPVHERILRERLEKSQKSFAGELTEPQYGKYLMMLEDQESGEIGGCSAVKAGVGIDQPFFNYRVITVAQASQAADRRFDLDALVLTNEFVGYTEVGTLFLREAHRGSGAGRLLAQSRYLLVASAPDRFGDMILAELRGVVDGDGQTPFWDAIGRHFFRMEFTEADILSAITDNQFILDLMPKYPIYVDLLPPEAREVIGRCHADGVGAMKLLEWEGFRFERTVDIFDGGPLVAAARSTVRTIRESRTVTVRTGDAGGRTGIMSNDRFSDFRATMVEGALADDIFYTSAAVLDRLRISEGETARIWLRS
ncbi:arginine N-succinyltransferase [Henriciella pelagia]|jgi:arginine N-succinyltransferase|uniref:Arginine N-succinyltransferase n=3 Tax=Henriciella pelagia TaxID=1977912 RepID=A0ABQ1J7J6_9PROT|nr:arginine N-succinyltransferase [Henriciella pelagia]GGB61927.1 arginine N-succinyltransferase [Henriciella pelagia]